MYRNSEGIKKVFILFRKFNPLTTDSYLFVVAFVILSKNCMNFVNIFIIYGNTGWPESQLTECNKYKVRVAYNVNNELHSFVNNKVINRAIKT